MKIHTSEPIEAHIHAELKRPETSRTLIDKLKHYTFPSCTREQIHETLNIMCVDPHCPNERQLDAFCARCSDLNLHKKPTHLQMSIRNTLKDLLRQCPDPHMEVKALAEDEVEKEFKRAAKAYRCLGQQCHQIADNLETSLDKYTKARSQSPEQYMVRKIISSILNKDCDERSLRTYLKDLHEYVLITEKGLVVNDAISQQVKEQIMLSSKNYIDYHKEVRRKVLSFSIEKLLGMGVIQDYDKLKRKKQAVGGNVDTSTVVKKDYTVPVPIHQMNKTMGDFEEVVMRRRSMTPTRQMRNLSPIDHNKYARLNETINRSVLHKSYNEQISPAPNISPSKTRHQLENELRLIQQRIRDVKMNAVKRANERGLHGGFIDWWPNWDTFVTENGRGWSEDNLHGSWDCSECYLILHRAMREIEGLERDYKAAHKLLKDRMEWEHNK